MKSIEQIVYETLQLTGIDVTQRPVTGTAQRYLTFNVTMGALDKYASNNPHRLRHTITIDLFSRDEPIARDVVAIVKLLHAHGFTVDSWGSCDYEADTRWYHIPITCAYAQKIGE